MKMKTDWSVVLKYLRNFVIIPAVCLSGLHAADPDWWSQQGFIDGAAAADDKTVVFQGQLKHAAAKAVDQLNIVSASGAGAELTTLEQAWASAHPDALDDDVMNLGQLKYVTDKVFERLILLGYDRPLTPGDADTRPSVFRTQWQQLGATDQKIIPTQGQLKYLFSFTFNTRLAGKHPDIDGDGIDNAQDADPFDYDINALSVQFTYPAQGALLQP